MTTTPSPDRLTEKLAGLEATRERIKTVNKAIRKHGYAKVKEEAIQPFDQYRTALLSPRLTEAEIRELEKLAVFTPYTSH